MHDTVLNTARLRSIAVELRCKIIQMIIDAGSGHPGGSLSAVDIITYLYFHHLRVDPARPGWEDRDRFVLSKGHCAPAVYAALAVRGYFPEETLSTLRDIDSKLQGHPDMKKTPGIDMTSGSLGQGFACAVGIALGGKFQRRDFGVVSMLGDGELQEGIVWEAAMSAAQYRLDNLIAVVDNNRMQTDGYTAEIMNVEPVEDKFRAFGWEAERIDGHDFAQIDGAFRRAAQRDGKPHVIVADTVKGKGIRSMEGNPSSHSLPATRREAQAYIDELLAEGQA